MYLCVHACVCLCIYGSTCLVMYVCMHVCMYACMRVCTYVYVYSFISVRLLFFFYIIRAFARNLKLRSLQLICLYFSPLNLFVQILKHEYQYSSPKVLKNQVSHEFIVRFYKRNANSFVEIIITSIANIILWKLSGNT